VAQSGNKRRDWSDKCDESVMKRLGLLKLGDLALS
jgi:hypothetical protein